MTMTMAEARAAIGDAVSAAIAEEFTRDQQQWLGDVPPPPTIVDGSCAAGHDASKVPAVPRAQLAVDHNSPSPGAVSTTSGPRCRRTGCVTSSGPATP